jgi:N-acetylmuramoyl-L-alanine amidase
MPAPAYPGAPLPRTGDEIMVAGQLFHTGAPVVLWTDPGGYDAYRVEKRFGPIAESSWEATVTSGRGPETPNRYGIRAAGLTPAQLEQVRGGGWDLARLRQTVDQFVIHYDAAGVSRNCFRVLHDARGLSVHFMLDVDGTIYQTLDLKERAWHATISNDRSIGIEIANIGAYPDTAEGRAVLARWYETADGITRLRIPPGSIRSSGAFHTPARPQPVKGRIHGRELMMYDLTEAQYDSLIKLTAALCTIFPNIPCDYPRDASGKVLTTALDPAALVTYRGILGHYHIQENKIDPGPAFDWERVVRGARALMSSSPGPAR